MRKICSLVICYCFLIFRAFTQDMHYSQFHSSPVMVNPAFTGLFNGDLRVIGNFKDQWSFAAPYRTFSLSADGAFAILKNGDFASAGIQLMADKAGDLNFTTLQSALSVSYSKALSGYGNHFLTVAFQAGLNRRSIDYTDIVAFDPEPFAQSVDNNFSYGDVSAGLTWYFIPSEEIYIYLGGSVFHLNEPNQSFLDDKSIVLDQRISLQGGFQLPISDNINLLPSAIFNRQGPHNETLLGTYFKYKIIHVTVSEETAFYAGLWYRSNDAFIASLRFDHNHYFVGLSYDVNSSSLTTASNGRGGLEVNFIYILDKKFNASKRMRNRSYQCPKF